MSTSSVSSPDRTTYTLSSPGAAQSSSPCPPSSQPRRVLVQASSPYSHYDRPPPHSFAPLRRASKIALLSNMSERDVSPQRNGAFVGQRNLFGGGMAAGKDGLPAMINARSAASLSRSSPVTDDAASTSSHKRRRSNEEGESSARPNVAQWRFRGGVDRDASDDQTSRNSTPRSSVGSGSSAEASAEKDSAVNNTPPLPKPAKRRFIRAGGIALPSSSPSPIKSSLKQVPTVPSNDQPEIDKARRVQRMVGKSSTEAQCLAALKECSMDPTKAVELVKKRIAQGANGTSLSGSPAALSRPPPSASAHRPVPSAASAVADAIAAKRATIKAREEEERMEDDSDEDDAGDDEAKQEAAALNWFNTADEDALIDTTGCNAAQAATILRLRPFASVDDVEDKLDAKSNKGITSKVFHNCTELMAGYFEVDSVLARCEKIGKDLQASMASWAINPSFGGASTSRDGTPAPPSASAVSAVSTVDSSTSTDAPVATNSTAITTPDSTAAPADVASTVNLLVKDPDYLHVQPSNMSDRVTLKDYQLAGVNWLALLYRKQTSALLADEMGLGKTAQVIAFLAHIKARGEPGPHLIVVPSSVLENWSREFKTFAPSIRVDIYYGSQAERRDIREELREIEKDLEVVLTTYDLAAGGDLDHKFLKKRGFNVCVFDEGHMLKNRKSQKYDKLLRIGAQWRLLLTGTPLQNNLQELISLLNFIMPKYFKDAEDALAAIFKVKANAKTNELSQQRVERARKMMQPFVLRRKKDKVLNLVAKVERIEFCDMTPAQAKLYTETLTRTAAAIAGVESTRAGPRGRGGTAKEGSGNILMDLRKAANHPLLFRTLYDSAKIAALAKDYVREPEHADENIAHVREDFEINTDAQLSMLADSMKYTRPHVLPHDAWLNAGKIHALQKLLPMIQARGDRVIIFSQFTTVLDILCVALDLMKVKYVGFTGQTAVGDRQVLVDQFTNDPSITVFLLSTKAGGLGINLVAANWVILFDQDFNPQNDKQAADRCYRMGQTKEVTVVKLICRDTIDEAIYNLGTRKLDLANRVSGEAAEEAAEEVERSITQSLMAELREKAVEAGLVKS